MQVFTYWARAQAELTIDGKRTPARFWGGSDLSADDAQRQALANVVAVQRRIDSGGKRDDSYTVAIREELLDRISERAVITRNHYGAHVLNTADRMIFDIDEPPTTLWDLFTRKTPTWQEARLRQVLTRCHAVLGNPAAGFRLYRTHKGFRVIVTGPAFRPGDAQAGMIATRLNTDRLYWQLCLRQDCYRARLTPKPFRMKHRTIKIRLGAAQPSADEIRAWNDSYVSAARAFSVCTYLFTIGDTTVDRLTALHDDYTGAGAGRPLA